MKSRLRDGWACWVYLSSIIFLIPGCAFFGAEYDPCFETDEASCSEVRTNDGDNLDEPWSVGGSPPIGGGTNTGASSNNATGGESTGGSDNSGDGGSGVGGSTGGTGGVSTGGTNTGGTNTGGTNTGGTNTGGTNTGGVGGIAGTDYSLDELKNLLSLNEHKVDIYVEIYFAGASIDLSQFSVATGFEVEPGNPESVQIDYANQCLLTGWSLSDSSRFMVAQQVSGACIGGSSCLSGCPFKLQATNYTFLLADGEIVDTFPPHIAPGGTGSWERRPDGGAVIAEDMQTPGLPNQP